MLSSNSPSSFSRAGSRKNVKVSFHTGLISLSLMDVFCQPLGDVLIQRVTYGSGVSTENNAVIKQVICQDLV